MAAEIWLDFFDILILPPESVRRQAIELSEKLHKHGSRWKLGAEEFIPHLSLYHLPVRPDDFQSFTDALDDSVGGFRGGDLRLTGISGRQIHLAVFLTTDEPRWLSRLYQRVIKATLPFYDESRHEETRARWGAMNLKMLKSFERYGTPMAGANFVPHFTLGTFDREEDLAAGRRGLEMKSATFRVDRVHVGLVGAEGFSCQGVVHEAVF